MKLLIYFFSILLTFFYPNEAQLSSKYQTQINFKNFAFTKMFIIGKTKKGVNYDELKKKKEDRIESSLKPVAEYFDKQWPSLFSKLKTVETLEFDSKIDVKNYISKDGKYLLTAYLNEINANIYVLLKDKPSEEDINSAQLILDNLGIEYKKNL